MSNQQPQPHYKIYFSSGDTFMGTIDQIQSPTLLQAIHYIEQECGCIGVTLANGIRVEKINLR